MNGIEMMVNAALKSLGVDKEFVQGQLRTLVSTVVEFKAQMDRIEQKLDAILEIRENGRKEKHRGNGQREPVGFLIDGQAVASEGDDGGGNRSEVQTS